MIKRDSCKMFLCIICLVIWSGALVPALAQGELNNASDSFLHCAEKPHSYTPYFTNAFIIYFFTLIQIILMILQNY